MRGKKRLLSLLLAAVLTLSLLLLPAAGAPALTFFAVDDTLVDAGFSAIYYGGQYYVSPGVFGYVPGVTFQYFSALGALTLYSDDSTLIFNLNDGTSYTLGSVTHDAVAVTSGGSVYVPLNFVSSYFGLTYVMLDTDYGTMIRIKSGAQVLSDTTFLSAVADRLGDLYRRYLENLPPEIVPGANDPVRLDITLRLFVTGSLNESTPDLLDRLAETETRVAFFTDAESVRRYPDAVLRIYAEGHSLGCLAYDEEAAWAFNDALDELLLTRSRLALGEESLADLGYVVFTPDVDARTSDFSGLIGEIVAYNNGSVTLRMDMNEGTWPAMTRILTALGSDCRWASFRETTLLP